MKKQTIFLLTMLVSGIASAQIEKKLPYNKAQLDSLFRSFPKSAQPFASPSKPYAAPYNSVPGRSEDFEAANPGALVISSNSKGLVYKMPADNMLVLVPDINAAERMPVASGTSHDNMPNLYPKQTAPKKKITTGKSW